MDYKISEDTLVDIADAIRAKKGSSDLIDAANFASEIENLPSGVRPVEFLYDSSSDTYNYTVPETGCYMVLCATADGRENIITLPSGRTPIVSSDCTGRGSKMRIIDLVEGDRVSFSCWTYSSYNKGICIFKISTNITELLSYEKYDGNQGVKTINNTGTSDTVLTMFLSTDSNYSSNEDRSGLDNLDLLSGLFGRNISICFKYGVDSDMKPAKFYTGSSNAFIERYIFKVS